MKKLLIAVALLLALGGAVLHYLHLDVLWWHSWRMQQAPAHHDSLALDRYRVDIQAQPIEGLDDDVSALTFNPQTGTLFAVLNGEPLLVELSAEGQLLRKVRINGVQDMEGLTYVVGSRFVIAEERTQRLIEIEIADDATELDVTGAPSLTIGLDLNGNKGFEGLSWDQRQQRLLVVKERDPLRVLAVTGFVSAPPGAPIAIRIEELKSPDSPWLFMRDLSSLSLHDDTGHLLLLSDESNMLVEYDEDSHPRSLLGLWRGMHGLEHTVPQAEGLAMDEQRRLYLVSEPNLFYRFVPGD
ncbi:MAG: SdiA-regulated domain-containing protein [Pseudomonas sp.]|uniref:SdiA-regulated domain-containing protein n=1 Tax=Pseudomonas sp. TaxID=306 RepID=UPI003241DA46